MTQHDSSFLFPLLIIKCPHCHEVTKFVLAEQVGYLVNFLGMNFGRMFEYKIRCEGCGYNEFVQKKDYASWKSLGTQFAALTNKKITLDQFDSFLEQLDLPELHDLILSSKTWNCSCGEINPPNFSECWKCHEPSPVETIEVKERRMNIGGAHPWEH